MDSIEANWKASSCKSAQENSYYASSYYSWFNYGSGVVTNIIENIQVSWNSFSNTYELCREYFSLISEFCCSWKSKTYTSAMKITLLSIDLFQWVSKLIHYPFKVATNNGLLVIDVEMLVMNIHFSSCSYVDFPFT